MKKPVFAVCDLEAAYAYHLMERSNGKPGMQMCIRDRAYMAVKPIISDFYNMVVGIFERASDRLGNMRGRQRQFAVGFIGVLNHYILLVSEQGGKGSIMDETAKKALVDQFMYGIYS